jgi:rare lipoprotein A
MNNARYSKPYIINGVKYYPLHSVNKFTQTGIASWYGRHWHGRLTASGERYNMYAMTAAHKTLPLGSYVHVKNLDNGKTAVVRINDRGPYVRGRIIDMSYAGAQKIGIVETGTARVRITLLSENKDDFEMNGRKIDLDKGIFYIQIASFTDKNNAYRLKKRLNKAVIQKAYINGKTFYRVRISGFKSRKKAEKYLRKIGYKFPQAYVVRDD